MCTFEGAQKEAFFDPRCCSVLVVSAHDCSMSGPRFRFTAAVVFITNAIVICSLGHGLHTSTAVPRSTCISKGSLNRVPASAGVRAEMSRLMDGR